MAKPPSTPQSQIDLGGDDLSNPKLSVSCLDFLLIELVPLAQRITEQLHAREQALINEFKNSKIFNSSKDTPSQPPKAQRDSNAPTITVTDGASTVKDGAEVGSVTGTLGAGSSTGVGGASGTTTGSVMDDETREAVFWRLDGLGYRVGQGLVER